VAVGLLAALVLSLGAAARLPAQASPAPAASPAASPVVPGDLAAASPAVRESALELKYDVYYSLLRLLTIESRSKVEPDVYSLESHMETVGLIGTFFPWTYRSEVHGRVDGAKLRPDVFSSHSEIRDRVQQVSLRYDKAGPQIDELTPFDNNVLGQEYTRDEVPANLIAGTIDPLTEIAAMSQQLARGEGCSGTRSVFDGLRRYDLVYEDLGETTLESSSYDRYAGPARQCRSHIKPIAGFWKPKEEKGEPLTSITAWMMPPLPGFEPVPVRMSVEGERGTLSIHLTKVSSAAS
jgi:Protein of unknown function (DUF3108)